MTERILDTLARDIRVGIFFCILLAVRYWRHRMPHSALKALWIFFFLQLAVPIRIPIPILKSAPVPPGAVIPAAVIHLTAEQPYAPIEPVPQKSLWGISEILLAVWVLGVLALALRAVAQLVLFRKQLKACTRVDQYVFTLPAGSVPFTLGIVRPKIYLPEGLTVRQREFILQHEWGHIRNLDTFFKPVVYIIAVLHWYNPLAWAAYRAFAQDLEMACDEYVVASLPQNQRLAYAQTLLDVLSGCTRNSFCVNAFGGSSVQTVKRRATNMMECKPYKRSLVLALVLLAALCSCAKVESIDTVKPTSVESASAGNAAMVSEEKSAGESTARVTRQEDEPEAIFSFSYVPAALEGNPFQIIDFGSDAKRTCMRAAVPDSSEYVMVLCSNEGTDTIDLSAAVPSDARQGAAVQIPYDAVRFAQDAFRFEYTLPKEGDTVLYFNEKGKDYFVIGTFPLDELAKVADSVAVP